jgi:putative membrane protein
MPRKPISGRLEVMTSERAISLAIRWLLLSFAVWVAAELLSGIRYNGWDSIFVVALILGVLNLYIRPALSLVALPLTILTLGVFLIVLNAVLLGLASWIAGWIDGIDFHVDDFWAALLGAIVISLVGMLESLFIKPDRVARDLTRGS